MTSWVCCPQQLRVVSWVDEKTPLYIGKHASSTPENCALVASVGISMCVCVCGHIYVFIYLSPVCVGEGHEYVWMDLCHLCICMSACVCVPLCPMDVCVFFCVSLSRLGASVWDCMSVVLASVCVTSVKVCVPMSVHSYAHEHVRPWGKERRIQGCS